jgi:hypothetical protein
MEHARLLTPANPRYLQPIDDDEDNIVIIYRFFKRKI